MTKLAATCLAILALSPPALADQPLPVVVELFTSQGCTACPPADALLSELADMDGVIALALHVDYWDYIGWPDSFADAAYTARQEAYARAAGERMVYTPQMIVGGQDRVVGGDAVAVMERLHARAGDTTPVDLTVARDGDALRIEATSGRPVPPLSVHVVRVRPRGEVAITGGENAGLTMTYSNIVAGWDTVGTWDGSEPLSLRVPASAGEPAVVLLQEPGPGRIVAAAKVD